MTGLSNNGSPEGSTRHGIFPSGFSAHSSSLGLTGVLTHSLQSTISRSPFSWSITKTLRTKGDVGNCRSVCLPMGRAVGNRAGPGVAYANTRRAWRRRSRNPIDSGKWKKMEKGKKGYTKY